MEDIPSTLAEHLKKGDRIYPRIRIDLLLVKVRHLLLGVALTRPEVLADPSADVIFSGLGDSSLDFELARMDDGAFANAQILKSDLYYYIFRVFADHGIEIPLPQRDIHVRSIDAALPVLNRSSTEAS